MLDAPICNHMATHLVDGRVVAAAAESTGKMGWQRTQKTRYTSQRTAVVLC